MRQQLAGLLKLADGMLGQACAGQWEEVARLQDRFQRCLETLFSSPIGRDEIPALADIVPRVSAISDEVMALCRNERNACVSDIEDVRAGRRAISSYSANTG